MQSTTLVVQIERAVMVIRVRVFNIRSDMGMAVGFDGNRLKHIQRMLVDQRDDPRDLREHKEPQ
jgi:hypothetical protein